MLDNNYRPFDHLSAGPMERKKKVNYFGTSYLLPMYTNWSMARAYTNRSNLPRKMTVGIPDSIVTVTKLRPRMRDIATPRYHFSDKSKSLRGSVPLKITSTDAKRRLTVRERQRKPAGPQGDSAAAAKRPSISSRPGKAAKKKRRNTNSLNKVTPSLHEVINSLRAELKKTIKVSKCLVAEAIKLSRRLKIDDGSPTR